MKSLKYIISALLLAVILFGTFLYYQTEPVKNPEWGISFSPLHAQYLGFDWKTMYLDILNDLQPKHLRLMAYWETMQPEPTLWYFQDVHEMLAEADKRNIEVTLSIGQKLPRWPECHHPAWFDGLTTEQKNEAQLVMIKMAVDQFKYHSSIKTWQVENEPFFNFGPMCPKEDPELLKKEIEIVRAADTRPIILTDSGELGRWIPAANLKPDIFGSTMYRVVHHERFGYFEYPLPPAFFRIKAGLTKLVTGVDKFRGVELQAEPWFNQDIDQTDLQTQFTLMNPKIFEANVAYARASGFESHDFWGVEWWYWLAHKQNDWGMWEAGKKILSE